MINTLFDKIFYINLEKDVDKNQHMIRQFEYFGITNFERFEGIVCDMVPEKDLWRSFIKKSEIYVKGSIGCRESHLGVIKLAKERGYERIAILEDDVVILEDLNKILETNLDLIAIADMFYFGGLIEPYLRGQVVGAYAYAVRSTIFDDIINMAIPSGMEIDNFYAKIIQHMSYNYNERGRYNVLLLQPFNSIIVNDTFKSNITIREDLVQLTELIRPYFTPKSFMEVGSRDGLDTKYVSDYWGLTLENTVIVEANRHCYQLIVKSMEKYPYAKVVFGAASNYDGEVEFNCVVSSNMELVGVSSIKKSTVINNLKYEQVKVPCFKLDKLITEHNVDLIKIDVEGHSFEVLEGMGDAIKRVKAIQVETEAAPSFENQKLDEEVNNFLVNAGFELISKKSCWQSQFDCLYINKSLIQSDPDSSTIVFNFVIMRDDHSIRSLESLVDYVGGSSNKTMIEIGSYLGESTQVFAKRFKNVISVDPYIDNYDSNDLASNIGNLDKVYIEFLKNTKQYDNIQHIRKTSDEAILEIQDKVDFVYIDGVHTYEQVVRDIENYKHLISPNGYIGGHDYGMHLREVVDAVNHRLGVPDYVFPDSSWIKKI